MAVAGKVAITPQGAWDSTVLYGKLSLVTHENAIYIAKKQSQGVVPVDGEYWMFCMQNAGAEDIQNIVNGTTVVGKATNDSDGNKISETYMKKILELSETDISDETELVSYEEEAPKKRTSVKMWEYIKGKIDSVLGIKGISNNVVTTESGYAVDSRQLNATVEGSYAKGVAEDISKINADLNQFLSNPRVEKDANELSGLSKMSVSEYSSKSANLPTPDWYHMMEFEGADELFKSQLAVGMTTDHLFMRRKDGGVWQNWLEIMTSSQSQLVQGSYTPVFNVENTGSADFTYTKQAGTYVRCGHLMFVKSQITGTVSDVADIESNSYLQMTLPQIDGKNYMIGLATLEYATGLGAIKSPYDTNLNEEQFHPVLRNNNINFYCAGNATKPVAGGIMAGIALVALLADK